MLRLSGLYRTVRRALCGSPEDMVKYWYAVRKGFKPGVYNTWDECKSQVFKFPNASYKKFGSEKDAWSFVRGVKPSDAPGIVPAAAEAAGFEAVATAASLLPRGGPEAPDYSLLPRRGPEALEYIPLGKKRTHSHTENPEESPSKRVKTSGSSDGFTYMGDAVVVYTDGCCSRNGKKGARAGIGVYWGPNHPLNVAEPLLGRQTNQRAELQAAIRALEQAKDMDIKKLVLYTDSKFTIHGVTSWVKNWKLNGWRLKSGGEVVNKDDFMQLDILNAEVEVVWLHIPGHAGYTGNEEADRLSREGAAKS